MSIRIHGVVVAALVAATQAPWAAACTSNPPAPPPRFWVKNHGFDQNENAWKVWVGQEVSLFPPTTSVTCACGLNLATPGGTALPPGVSVKEAGVFIVNLLTHEMTPVFNFEFQANPTTTSALAGLSPGGSWFGLTSSVAPFVPDPLPPGFVYKLLFLVNVDGALGGFNALGRIGAGLADPNGVPDPSEFHFFSPLNRSMWLPTPGGAALALAAMLVGVPRRRRA